MEQDEFTNFINEHPEANDNLEFISSICVREDGSSEIGEILLKFYDTATIASVIEFYKVTAECFEYQGFDPARLIVEMINTHKKFRVKNPNAENEVAADLSDSEKIYKHETFHKEMSLLIMIFLIRGSNVKKIMSKSVTQMSKLIKHLSLKYNIFVKDEKREKSLTPTSVTLARVASCFPMMTITLFSNEIGRTLAPQIRYFGENVPRSLLAPGIAAAVPRMVNSKSSIHHAILWINYINDKIINQGQKRKETPITSLISFHRAAFNSSTLSDSLRIKLCQKTGLMNNNAFKEEVIRLDKKALERFSAIDETREFFPLEF